MTEISVGSELTTDHYKPRSAGGTDDLDNLVYACHQYNSNKHDFWPTAEDLANGRRVLHPLFDDISQHLALNQQTCRVEPLTETGRFHITLLHLNRPQLVKRRLAQQVVDLLQEKQKLLEQQIRELAATVEAQEHSIKLWEMINRLQ